MPQNDFSAASSTVSTGATYTGTLATSISSAPTSSCSRPAATVSLTPHWTVGGRYAFTSTDTAAVTGIKESHAGLRAARELRPAHLVRGRATSRHRQLRSCSPSIETW